MIPENTQEHNHLIRKEFHLHCPVELFLFEVHFPATGYSAGEKIQIKRLHN